MDQRTLPWDWPSQIEIPSQECPDQGTSNGADRKTERPSGLHGRTRGAIQAGEAAETRRQEPLHKGVKRGKGETVEEEQNCWDWSTYRPVDDAEESKQEAHPPSPCTVRERHATGQQVQENPEPVEQVSFSSLHS